MDSLSTMMVELSMVGNSLNTVGGQLYLAMVEDTINIVAMPESYHRLPTHSISSMATNNPRTSANVSTLVGRTKSPTLVCRYSKHFNFKWMNYTLILNHFCVQIF